MSAISNHGSTSQELLEELRSLLLRGQKTVYLSGIQSSFLAFLISKATSIISRGFLVIASDNDSAEQVCEELQFYIGQETQNLTPVLYFPGWETLPFDTAAPHPQKVVTRLETLHRLQNEPGSPIVVTTLRALMQHCIPFDALQQYVIPLCLHEQIERDSLTKSLSAYGYRQVHLVEEVGEYSIRGGILDVFPPTYPDPLRLEFFGDRVESLRQFNPITQRSVAYLENVYLLPVSEIVWDESAQKRVRESVDLLRKEKTHPPQLITAFSEMIENHSTAPGMPFLLEFFYEQMGTPFDYLAADTVVWVYDIPNLKQKTAAFFDTVTENLLSARAENRLSSLGSNLYLTPAKTLTYLETLPTIWIETLEILHPENHCLRFVSSENRDVCRQITERKSKLRPLAKLVHRLKIWLAEHYTIIIVVHSETQQKRLQELLEGYDLTSRRQQHFVSINDRDKLGSGGGLILTTGQIQRGFRSPPDRLVVLTETEIFGEKPLPPRRSETAEGDVISRIDDLMIDDFVVHVDYGIGLYKGLHVLEAGGSKNDYLLIGYRDGDRLYVPVYRLNLVQKYRGVENELPILDKLGGKTWSATKKKVTESIKTYAKELLAIYAARQGLNGFSFSPRDQYCREFEARFEYDETPDQISAIEDVMVDMESQRPMDRLICGDVGYGKTEVAMRASFKAVMDNKQVAVLVPTTILAHQHYQTFKRRFHEFPLNIAMLSRFQTHREQKEVVHQTKKGAVDILIGTHRVLQKDVDFDRLGLLIVDEEHRFGVNHKEKLKTLRTQVDVLTLTATPIPRTLQLSLLGIRDLSVIKSPPEDRRAVRTYLTKFGEKIIREAIIREFMREGQVFFVHNRVEKIEALAHFLKRLVPEARLGIAHGQLPEKELEKVMWAFHKREINLLLCTSIIESGLDFPHANTILINRADKMGLAQLYQLRGRVGRSNHQAFAYLLIPNEHSLTDKARKRLKVFTEFSDLGSGFRLANYDLEIRGGGNILGLSQSGNMAQVGIELYYQLIEKAVKEIKKEKILPDVDPEISVRVPAYIPESYISDIHQRLRFYKRLSNGLDDRQLADIEYELHDRFGPVPEETKNLLLLARLKPYLKKYSVTSLDCKEKAVILAFHPEGEDSFEKVLELIRNSKERVRFTPDHKLHIPFQSAGNWADLVEKIKNVLQ
ncbi:MAG: transcription-repair coupling factor [Deltaproteobacteria bacterium]|nr:transcription-repair coupling factor [Deltaproteobacteria bacterium]